MKSLYILSLFVFITSLTLSAQESTNCEITKLIMNNRISFQIVGERSEKYVDELFAKFPKTKRKGYIWKFKNISIPGLEKKLTFQVSQGIHGYEGSTTVSSKTCRSSYFRTFSSEKLKQTLLNNQKDTEQLAILIYIKDGRKYGVATDKEADLVKNYISSLIKKE